MATSSPVSASILENTSKATIAAGCFWGVEHLFRKEIPKDQVPDMRVGYIGGDTDDPKYRAVCSGSTGHAEALQMYINPDKVSYKSLLEFFYKMHDPTTPDRQGPDRGTQYRSGIFYHDEEQKKIAEQVTQAVDKQWWNKDGSSKVTTELVSAGKWWDAEAYHQLYLDQNPGAYECPSHYIRRFADLQY